MKSEIKERWLHDLRSGEIKQARGVLRTTEDEFCCLGVLCTIVDPSKWTGDTVMHDIDDIYDPVKDEYLNGGEIEALVYDQELAHSEKFSATNYTFLSGALLREVGLDESIAHKLAEMNDEGVPFTALADYIEESVAV